MDPNGQSILPLTDHRRPHVSKKRKRNSERARVTRACDRCKKRKIKCDGTQPCDFCTRAKANCTFNSSYARGRVPVIPSASDATTESNSTSLEVEETLGQSVEHPAELEPTTVLQGTTVLQSHDIPSTYLAPEASAYVTASSQSSPEPSQDLQGHYIGPASGVSFLLRVQKRLHQAISVSQASTIFTFGDAPLKLPEFDPSFCMMLPREDAQRLVDRYFDFAMPTYRFLHRPTIQEWFVEFYDTLGIMRDAHSAPAKISLLFMVFAHARVYMPDTDKPGPADLSTRYFLAAEHQLTKERGSVQLTSVQARLTQCFYLLTQSRINHCWSLFGTMSHLALAIGLNRNKRPDVKRGLSVVEAECRRRTFWCAYTLDAYLSIALGRPRSFNDDDIDTELPACVDDDQLTIENITASARSRTPSIMLAPLAHIKLARIISKIVRDLYSIKPISTSRRSVLTERISKDLSDWQVELSRFLDTDFFSSSLVHPIYQRQQNVLNLTYWHAIILAHRPFVLTSFAQLSRQGSGGASEDAQTAESVQQCLMAAMKTVKTINDITQNRQMFQAFWITAYFAFTATIMLYIYVIQQRASSPELYSSYFSAAAKCQSHISAMAEKGSLSERYSLVLEELRVEALRQVKRMHPSITNLGALDEGGQRNGFQESMMSIPMHDTPSTVNSYTDVLGESAIDFNGMPSSAFTDSTGWGQFASMVSSGMGNFDFFLNDGTFTI
ncbi:transcriptional regulatory protein GAL4 [Dactylonectria macrodidyma]|uniref:Transcriptional regulatory protein GAL4 n=1 Tax=Dactylonectria macrodidyma TaxID=307937 RepID=A0A9P9E2F1_9HYPO|nr:transcriptional regulatory protein GAL4 [Dactylonectria macrodidyma]